MVEDPQIKSPPLQATGTGKQTLRMNKLTKPEQPSRPKPKPKEIEFPTALEAEKAIIGCILENPAYSIPILKREGLGPRAFTDLRYAAVMEICRELHAEGKPVD